MAASSSSVAVDAAKLKSVKIKVGVVRRYTKEKLSYEKEVKMQEDKIKKFEEEGKDEYFMKQQVNSLKESQLMIPDTQRRLLQAYNELKDMISDIKDPANSPIEEYKSAHQVLQDAKAHLPEK